ncbi:hypothetical protein KA078_00395 [Candidatus Woesebacteria bacterium]|nr:hypothetical protein [Candidatus Woesebacteria bacterium]
MNAEVLEGLLFMQYVFIVVGLFYAILCAITLPFGVGAQFAIAAAIAFFISTILCFLTATLLLALISYCFFLSWLTLSVAIIDLEN